jgi:hypothetical protein
VEEEEEEEEEESIDGSHLQQKCHMKFNHKILLMG